MLSVAEIRDVKFSKAPLGYKGEEVDILLDKVEADYAAFERILKEYELKVETLNSEIESFKNSQNSIQNVLVSAQGLADRIVKEAKDKSEEIIKQAQANIEAITTREKELSSAFEVKAQEQKTNLEKELKAMIEEAQKKSDAITAATEERVKHQQMLFDKLRLEISAFKSGVTSKYKEHIELLSKIPDSVPSSPEYIAQVLSASFEKTEPAKTEETDISSSSDKTDTKSGFIIDTEEED
ncbi:MAG: DivIVA domain-containing protein [Clostridia bacterium]|nr:DivIVA domain-containing protein [Clostridia bacterium]